MIPSQAAHVIQNVRRSQEKRRIGAYIMDQLTCTVCTEMADVFVCHNHHPVCQLCLTSHFHNVGRDRRCCVCRDERGYIRSPFTKLATEMNLKVECSECETLVDVRDATRHRLTCKFRPTSCSVKGCTHLPIPRAELVPHISVHHGHTCDCFVCPDGRNEVIVVMASWSMDHTVVWPAHDRVVHLTVSKANGLGVMMSQAQFFDVNVSTFGDDTDLTIKNIHPCDGRVYEQFHLMVNSTSVDGEPNAILSYVAKTAEMTEDGPSVKITSLIPGSNAFTAAAPVLPACGTHDPLETMLTHPSARNRTLPVLLLSLSVRQHHE